MLKESKEQLTDSRWIQEKPLRQSWELPLLSRLSSSSNTTGNFYLYEAQISVTVTGIDDSVWTSYGFFDTYFGSRESITEYHKIKSRLGRPDPLTCGQLEAEHPIWTPREYFFKVLEIRTRQVRSEWNFITDRVHAEIKQYVYIIVVLF